MSAVHLLHGLQVLTTFLQAKLSIPLVQKRSIPFKKYADLLKVTSLYGFHLEFNSDFFLKKHLFIWLHLVLVGAHGFLLSWYMGSGACALRLSCSNACGHMGS